MDIKALAQKYQDYMVEMRRHFHQHPELTHECVETCKRMREEFVKIGITDITDSKTCQGFVARLKGGKPGKTVGLRADIDALPVNEETGLPFASQTPGKMHACGHDNHMACILGAAKVLYEIREELCGTVAFIVQPDEEFATGALAMVDEGLVNDCDAFYGQHVWGAFPEGMIDASAGNRMACCHHFGITVEGLSSHASAPHLGCDAVVVMTAILNAIQTMVSRWNDPLNPLVITVGKVDAGNRWNVLAGKAELEGTVRTFLSDDSVEKRLEQMVKNIGEAYGANCFVHDYLYMTVPVINDSALSAIVEKGVADMFGEERILHHEPLMGSEDYSWFGFKTGKPYVYTFIGTRNEADGRVYVNHHEKYDVKEDLLQDGAAVMARFAYDYLNGEE